MTCNPTSSSHGYVLAELLIGDVLKRLLDVWIGFNANQDST